jgi:HD superfamily phosphohydrolase
MKETAIPLLIEGYKKEIWEWKQKESQWIKDKNQLDGNKQIVEELSTKLIEMGKTNLILKKRVQEAEGETHLVKAVGMNSPEMKSLKAINESHQKLNGELQKTLTEVREDNKKLAQQIQDLNSRLS